MDIRLNNLKQDFTKIVDIKNENVKTFITLSEKIKKLKEFYADFIKNNKQNLFMFGLDSFHFQGKLIDIEYDDMHRLFDAIINRMYCEYYKLCKIIIEYIHKNISEKKVLELTTMNSNFPVYKDLEPFKKYDFDHIQNLHENILVLLQAVYGYLLNKEHELKIHQMKNNIGLNIDNFVYTFQYNNIVIREKLSLYITYIEFFHRLHNKYLKRFTTKLQLMFSQITHDIKFDDTVQMNKTRRKSMMETLESDNIDETLMTDLKSTMGPIIFSDDVNFLIDEIPEEIVSSSTLSKYFQEEDAHKVVVEVFTKEEENHLLEEGVPGVFVEEVVTSVEAPPVAPEAPPVVAPVAPEAPPVAPEAPPVVPEAPPVVPEAPPVVPEAPPVVPEEPPVAPEAPPVVPEEPPVAPEAPPVVPEAPPVAPEAPPVVPEDPPVAPEAPPVAPEAPPVVPEDPPVVTEKPVEDASVEEDAPVAPEDPAVAPVEELVFEGSSSGTTTETPSTEVEQP